LAQHHEYYYLNSYINNYPDSSNIQFSIIDLDQKMVVSSTRVPIEGELEPKIPLAIENNGRKYLVILAVNGISGKNTKLLPNCETNYTIYDITGNQVNTGTFPGMHLFGFRSFLGQNITLTCVSRTGDRNAVLKGILSLDNQNQLSLVLNGEDQDDEISKPQIGRFDNYHTIFLENNRLYSSIDKYGIRLMAFDVSNRLVLDTLKVSDDIKYSYLFGQSPNDSLVYIFHLNYNELGGPESLQKIEMDSSYLKIINAHSFDIIDSIYIPNPLLELGYTFGELGTCDRIGPYFVYYFFKGEDYRYYSPAMLFIFDTRTNQATWLRVGWR